MTDGIFLDENVIFDQTTPEWNGFCKNSPEFEASTAEPSAEAMPGQENLSTGGQ